MGTSRIVCLDIGAVRIGVAVSDPLGMFAQGVTVLSARKKWKRELDGIMEKFEASRLLVGLPLRTDGTRGPEARRILDMAEALKKRYPEKEILIWDERFSTVTAHQALQEGGVSEEKRRGMVDRLAAVVILQSYLDALREGVSHVRYS